jgi:hypothetical protein
MGVIFQSGMAIGAVPGYSNYGITRGWLLGTEDFGCQPAWDNGVLTLLPPSTGCTGTADLISVFNGIDPDFEFYISGIDSTGTNQTAFLAQAIGQVGTMTLTQGGSSITIGFDETTFGANTYSSSDGLYYDINNGTAPYYISGTGTFYGFNNAGYPNTEDHSDSFNVQPSNAQVLTITINLTPPNPTPTATTFGQTPTPTATTEGPTPTETPTPTPSSTPTPTPTATTFGQTPTPTPTGSGVGSWYFYSDEGNINASPPTADGNAIFTIQGSPVVETFNPNKADGVSYLVFNLNDSIGTDYTSQFSGYTGGTGTITLSQNGDTATYTSTTPGSYFIDPLGFFVISTAACTQTKSSNNTYVFGIPISLTFGS